SGVLFYFFFQAEDGIRAFHVTGVQTCALPISGCPRRRRPTAPDRGARESGAENGDAAARRRPWTTNLGSSPPPRQFASIRERAVYSCSAMATALKSAEALLTVSWNSDSGTLSATTPAPAWMWIRPSLMSDARGRMHESTFPA